MVGKGATGIANLAVDEEAGDEETGDDEAGDKEALWAHIILQRTKSVTSESARHSPCLQGSLPSCKAVLLNSKQRRLLKIRSCC